MSIFIVPKAQGAMPTAGLPIEPASSLKDIESDAPADLHEERARSRRTSSLNPNDGTGTVAPSERTARASSPRSEGDGDFGAAIRLSMIRDGFGAQIKLLEYPVSWLAITQTARYFQNDQVERLHKQRQGYLIGFDLHPWRHAFISPFLNMQAGYEKFYRYDDQRTLDSSVGEASAGLELRLGHLASISGQWTEAYYPSLREAMFTGEENARNPRHHAIAEILFNLKWETSY